MPYKIRKIKSRKIKSINEPILISQCLLYDDNDLSIVDFILNKIKF